MAVKKKNAKRTDRKDNSLRLLVILGAIILVIGLVFFIYIKNTIPSAESLINNVNIPAEYSAVYSDYEVIDGGQKYTNLTYNITNGTISSCTGSQTFFQGIGFSTSCATGTAEDFGARNVEELINEIKGLDIADAKVKKIDGRNCIYNLREKDKTIKKIACFNERDELVNYAEIDVFREATKVWFIQGYKFTDKIIELLD